MIKSHFRLWRGLFAGLVGAMVSLVVRLADLPPLEAALIFGAGVGLSVWVVDRISVKPDSDIT
jgi:hypothetical protein